MDFVDILDLPTLDNISAALDLRQPNREAVETIAIELGRHYDIEHNTEFFEGVVDAATGVGKTYIFAAALEYLAQVRGVRDFVLVAPSKTILQKTIDQFTLGHPKCIINALPAPVTLITADNFNTPTAAAAMEDEGQVKLYVFTVQSLIKPTTKAGRKTHEFQEGLGSGFYQRLKDAPLLTVFADEHHAYYGDKFSDAVRALEPWALIGLTATPHPKTPKSQIIYRYPLAAAIADKYVKTPIIVGRSDDKSDPATKLMDGIELLERKRHKADEYADAHGLSRVNSIMLVVASSVDEADNWADLLRSDVFLGGAYADAVLVVHSDVKADTEDEARELRRLQDIEHPNSPIKIVVSVQMLKEGWDVKNVYVLLSTRPLVSELLAEQVLGRGLRLPFGKYTDVQLLDSLEVIAHEKFEELLAKKNGLNEQFIDYKTRTVLQQNSDGVLVPVRKQEQVDNEVRTPSSGEVTPIGVPVLMKQDQREKVAADDIKMKVAIVASRQLSVPRLRTMSIKQAFSLSDITDLDAFTQLGKRISADPEGTLRRVVVGARIVEDESGFKQIRMTTEDAVDRIGASTLTIPIDTSQQGLVEVILAMDIVSAREDVAGTQRSAAEAIVDAFLDGMGEKAEHLLSAFYTRAAAGLKNKVEEEYKRYLQPPQQSDEVEVVPFGSQRYVTRGLSPDRWDEFSKSSAYEGWTKSLYPCEWFDSSTERYFANALDGDDSIEYWVRLQRDDLIIVWSYKGQQYNPDFIVHEVTGDDWLVEVKMDKEANSEDVKAKREAAKRWVNRVNYSKKFPNKWHYLLVTETDVKTAKGSWAAVKQLGS